MKKEIDLDWLRDAIQDEVSCSTDLLPDAIKGVADRVIAKIVKPTKDKLVEIATLVVNSGNHYGADLRWVAQGYLDLVAEGEKTAVQAAPVPAVCLDCNWVTAQLGDFTDLSAGRTWVLYKAVPPRLSVYLVLRDGYWVLTTSYHHPTEYFARIKHRHEFEQWQNILGEVV